MTKFDEDECPGWNDQQDYPTLTVGCAVCLLSRIHPVDGQRKSYKELPADTVSKGYRITYAISCGELPTEKLYVSRDGRDGVEVDQFAPGDHVDWRTVLRAGDFAAWCDRHSLEHPWSSSKHIDGGRPKDKPLATRERETLLQLIAVLAELAGNDLRPETKGHAEASSIMEELRARKVRTEKRTVAAKLTAGRQLIAPKGPGRVATRSK